MGAMPLVGRERRYTCYEIDTGEVEPAPQAAASAARELLRPADAIHGFTRGVGQPWGP